MAPPALIVVLAELAPVRMGVEIVRLPATERVPFAVPVPWTPPVKAPETFWKPPMLKAPPPRFKRLPERFSDPPVATGLPPDGSVDALALSS